MRIVASYSLNHPTLPNVRVRVLQDNDTYYIQEFRNDDRVREHYFPKNITKRQILSEARQLLRERREGAL